MSAQHSVPWPSSWLQLVLLAPVSRKRREGYCRVEEIKNGESEVV